MDLWELDVRSAPQPACAPAARFPDECPRAERSLYLGLAAIQAGAAAAATEQGAGAAVFLGGNAADLASPARAGLRGAARLPGVVNPLADLPPAAVTALAQVVIFPLVTPCAIKRHSVYAHLLSTGMWLTRFKMCTLSCRFGSFAQEVLWAGSGARLAGLWARRGGAFHAALANSTQCCTQAATAGSLPVQRAARLVWCLKSWHH